MSFNHVMFEKSGQVATITLNEPDRLNPLDLDMGAEIMSCLDEIDRDTAVEIVVFRGAGRAFCAGGDVGEGHLRYHMRRTDGPSHPEEMGAMMRFFVRMFERIERMDQIVIGVVHGVCAGGGVELSTCFDVVIAGEDARFADAHLNVGQLPGAGGSQRLSRLLGPLRAKELLLTGRFVKAREACEMGLATYCVPKEELENKLQETIKTLLSKSYAGRAGVKYLINQGLELPLPAAVEMERLFTEHYGTTHPDSLEGLRAFAEKRKPAFLRRDQIEVSE